MSDQTREVLPTIDLRQSEQRHRRPLYYMLCEEHGGVMSGRGEKRVLAFAVYRPSEGKALAERLDNQSRLKSFTSGGVTVFHVAYECNGDGTPIISRDTHPRLDEVDEVELHDSGNCPEWYGLESIDGDTGDERSVAL